LSDDIIEAMNTRHNYATHHDIPNRNIWKNKVTNMIRQAKSDYYKTLIEENANNSRAMWKYLRDLAPSPVSKVPESVEVNGSVVTEPAGIANAFNNFFCNIANTYLTGNTTDTPYDPTQLKDYIKDKINAETTFTIPPIEEEMVEKQLNGLILKKATGIDQISAKLLKAASPIIAKPLTTIFNLSISGGVVPTMWKTARVTAIHKSGDLNTLSNYRPISVLPLLSKIIEKHVHTHLYKYLTDHNLLHSAQSGFRANHSCESALTRLVDMWSKAINNNQMNGVVLLDLRKAFDLVDHKVLLDKLDYYQLSSTARAWFKSYLNERSQTVVFKGTPSEKSALTVGVPQGSILGPLLFIIHLNDLPLKLQETSLDMYADDSTMTVSHCNITNIESCLNSDLQRVQT
jgi:hypothetical protein